MFQFAETAPAAGPQPVEPDGEFWHRVLVAGGSTRIPRWTLEPAAGQAEHVELLPDTHVAALRRLAEDLGMPLGSVLLAAHAKVLAALSGERDVATGYVAVDGGQSLPCRIGAEPGSWRDLLKEAHRAGAEALAHRYFPVDELRSELGLDKPFETVFDPTGGAGDLPEDVVLRVGIARADGHLVARLRYRTDALDADAAARIAGYHLAALASIAADSEADHGRGSLLSGEELRHQIDGLAGPRRELPDLRFHELFEQRAKAHPDDVAAIHGDRTLTYAELNERANVLARALLSRGLRPEGVVAVVTERNLDWMTAVIAVFKAGGTYLPIEPHFPADRIAATLSRAGCELVLAEPGSTGTLDGALESLPAAERLFVGDALAEGHAGHDLGLEIGAGRLAYIYFTSGSTGEPKGAMCEHAGMLNHLYAKIEDLEIGEGQTVAQTAPQCFDISLWQLVSALLVGGRTLLVEQDVIMDVERFVERISSARVNVLQVVPSYLEVALSYLEEHERDLPELRFVSVTGEALKRELAARWFEAQPGIRLVNAYGLTETSDDTNHEVMDRVPEGERVPLGPAVNNVRVYVVDEHLSPVPLGAPGEIVFSGVCVGRGYVNDPERTAQAFMSDPHREGERLYRAGDFGRWLPDGKLEFLGRRDAQVKIRGFRIEIGEIESRLLRAPGVASGAVVVAERSGAKQLVAFYSGEAELAEQELKARLADALPEYMVPSSFHWRERLPLTGNGKVDRKALTALAAELGDGEEREAPATESERRVAEAWAKVLGMPAGEIGRGDSFFDRGGTSLSAVKLVIALDREVSLGDVTRLPVLADQARLLDGGPEDSSGLLQTLAEGDGAGTLVCFPYAGGNAVNFQPLAGELRGSGLAIHAVELPGHDLAAEREEFAPIAEVAERVAAEIASRGLTGLILWGQSSGTALAVETARRLEAAGVTVERLFLGAHLPGDPAERRTAAEALAERDPREIATGLADQIGEELDAERAEHVGAAYRHDCVAAHHWFAEELDGSEPAELAAPVTVVLAADDPATAGSFRDWRKLADQVDLHELADGGHHFLRTRPAEAAQAVWRATGERS
jgi:amino acid adenylation domain-containing protein